MPTYILIFMKDTFINKNEKKYNIIFNRLNNTWERKCPTCKKIISHKTLPICKKLINIDCKSCTHTTKNIPPNNVIFDPLCGKWGTWYKICPKCKNKIPYNGKTTAINLANKLCKNCMPHPKWTEWKKQQLSEKGKNRWSNIIFRQKINRHFTTYRKNNIEKHISFNPKVCDWLDKKNQELAKRGIFFRHQKNNPEGEFSSICYFADGYDEKNNIWFEYDEPHHEYSHIKKKDEIREKRLIGKLKCRFIRYSEKKDQLYEKFKDGKLFLLNDFKDL